MSSTHIITRVYDIPLVHVAEGTNAQQVLCPLIEAFVFLLSLFIIITTPSKCLI